MAEHDQRFKRLLQTFFVEFLQLFFPTHASRLYLGRIDWLDKELLADTPTTEPLVLDLVARLPYPESPSLSGAGRGAATAARTDPANGALPGGESLEHDYL